MHVYTNKKHLKNVGPIRYCEPPLHCQSPGVASRTPAIAIVQAAFNVHNDDDNDNAWQRGPLWPHGMGPNRFLTLLVLAAFSVWLKLRLFCIFLSVSHKLNPCEGTSTADLVKCNWNWLQLCAQFLSLLELYLSAYNLIATSFNVIKNIYVFFAEVHLDHLSSETIFCHSLILLFWNSLFPVLLFGIWLTVSWAGQLFIYDRVSLP